MYDQGLGVSQDNEQAVAWYRKAADQGYAVAQYNLGWDCTPMATTLRRTTHGVGSLLAH